MRRDSVILVLAIGLMSTVGGGSSAQAGLRAPEAFGPVLLIDVDAHTDRFPEVAWSSQCPAATQFLTVWEGYPPDVPIGSVWGRYTDDTATVLDPNKYELDPGSTSGPATGQNVAANETTGAPAAGFIFVYEDAIAGGEDIYANLIDCNGVPLGGDILVTNDGPAVADLNPDVACGTTVCWVVWETFVGPNTRTVEAASIDGAGTITGYVTLSGASTTARSPAIAANAVNGCDTDSFLAVWQDQVAGSFDILGVELDETGMCAATATIAGSGGDEVAPDVAFGAADGLYEVVVQSGGNIFGRVTDAAGVPAGPRVNICVAAATQANPAVAYDDIANRFLTVWQDRRNAANGWDIWGQRTTGLGALMGVNVQFPSQNSDAKNPSVAFSSGSARFYVNWDRNQTDVFGVAIF